MKKEPIADAIRTRIILRFGGLKAAVRNLGLISYDSLRQDLTKNRFFEDDLLRICRELGLTSNLKSLQQQYEFEIKKPQRGVRHITSSLNGPPTLSDAFGVIDARMERIRRVVASAREVVPRFFEAMGSNDLLAVFISDELPSHWIGPESAAWGKTICDALERGAMILYFYPSDGLCQEFRTGCSASMAGLQVVEPAFKAFQRRLTGLGLKAPHLNKLAIVECGNPAAFTPQHRYGIYFHHRGDTHQLRSTEAIPITHDAGADEAPSRFWVLASSYKFTMYLEQVCEWSLNTAIDESTNKDRIAQLRNFLDRCYFKD